MKNRVIGLNLLKTIAIISVLIYHVNPKILSGGFIGVDLFFAISGYLLAHSLIKNRDKSLKELIIKRIGQLWLPLFLVIVAMTIYLTLFNAPALKANRQHIFYGLTFTSNWGFIFNNVGYFDSFLVNPYKHLWYIAVLIQSTIIIIILFKMFIKLNFKKYNVFIILMIVIFTLSLILQQLLLDMKNVSRVYYGTDTRIYTIVAGVLLYFIYPIDNLQDRKNIKKFFFVNIVGILAIVLYVVLTRVVIEFDAWVYRFGFPIFMLNSLLLIVTIGDDTNILTNILSRVEFLLYPGKISYEIYLWHYPIIVLSQFASEAAQVNPIYSVIRILVTIIVAKVMYDSVGAYLNKQGFIKSIENNNWLILIKMPFIYPFLILFLMGSTGYAVPYLSTAFVDTTRDVVVKDEFVTDGNLDNSTNIEESEGENQGSSEKTESDSEVEVSQDTNSNSNENNVVETPTQEDESNENSEIKYNKIILIADSTGVMVGQRIFEKYPNSIIDAKVSRQMWDGAEVASKYASNDSKETALVIMLGTNGAFTEQHLLNITNLYPKSKKVFVNVKMPNVWEKRVNDELKAFTEKYPDIELVDWYSTAIQHPEYLASDKTHVMPEGEIAQLNLILEKLR